MVQEQQVGNEHVANQYRITLWSGGKPAMVHYISEIPQMKDGLVAFRTDEGNIVRIMGNISIEEGEFRERPITGRGGMVR